MGWNGQVGVNDDERITGRAQKNNNANKTEKKLKLQPTD